ncbi:hypothetical protein CAPTEDRAFT_208772 [Capitella teleta]|uniref:G-protein coupled receptors family 1 profile domain-containing protein n=1 Tax=Capitella teleta TaxID=283909 RepID=R7TYU3_CAPTE|nr:hypothetical protein CAPTEDRAFT_208772 [Capitella teleta]|eukprot:ELT96130.1 hypothetical protein CAPTEDRAFT_208772 [Capitella teleta]
MNISNITSELNYPNSSHGNAWEAPPTLGPPMSCEEYIINMSTFASGVFNTRIDKANQTTEEKIHDAIVKVVTFVAVPILCVFGILGNVFNLLVLTRKQLLCTMDRLEKSAHIGLVALAISDAIFCVLYFLSTLTFDNLVVYTQLDPIVVLYYNIYHEPFTNIFLFSSTWLTVVMALGRYIAICHPFRARGFISRAGTRAAIACVFIGSILVNLPRFWHYYASQTSCSALQSMAGIPSPVGGCECNFYMKSVGGLYKNKTFKYVYGVCCSILGIFLPLVILTVCNVCLIKALRQSSRMQRRYRVNHPRDSSHRITPTLIAIIVLFTLLVTPSEVLAFFKEYIISKQDKSHYLAYNTAISISNFLLVTNFSINFVLYCVINVQFRNIVKHIVCCLWCRKKPPTEYFKTNTVNSTTLCNVSDMETEV